MTSLNKEIQNYFNLSLASTTHQTCISGEIRYKNFIHYSLVQTKASDALAASGWATFEWVCLIPSQIYKISLLQNLFGCCSSLPLSAIPQYSVVHTRTLNCIYTLQCTSRSIFLKFNSHNFMYRSTSVLHWILFLFVFLVINHITYGWNIFDKDRNHVEVIRTFKTRRTWC